MSGFKPLPHKRTGFASPAAMMGRARASASRRARMAALQDRALDYIRGHVGGDLPTQEICAQAIGISSGDWHHLLRRLRAAGALSIIGRSYTGWPFKVLGGAAGPLRLVGVTAPPSPAHEKNVRAWEGRKQRSRASLHDGGGERQKIERVCLHCREKFTADGRFNRLCGPCAIWAATQGETMPLGDLKSAGRAGPIAGNGRLGR